MIPKITYMESLFLFWFRGSIAFEQNIVKLVNPNEILGIIPAGKKKKNIPLTQISSVATNFKIKLGHLLIGLLFLMTGFTGLKEEDGFAVFLICLLIAIVQMAGAFQTILTITLTSGEEINTEFIVFEKAKAEQAADTINEMVANRYADTNVREQTDRVVSAINQK